MDVMPVDANALQSDQPEAKDVSVSQSPQPVLSERTDSIVIEIPNGLQIEIAPPPVATPNVIANIFAEETQPHPWSLACAKACMYVRSINGVPQPRPTNKTELQMLQNKLLDDGLEHIIVAMNEYFPPVTKDSLKVIKKNLR